MSDPETVEEVGEDLSDGFDPDSTEGDDVTEDDEHEEVGDGLPE